MSGMKIQSDAIKELASILDETGLTEIEVSEGDRVIRIARNGAAPAMMQAPAPVNMPSDPQLTAAPASKELPVADLDSHPGAVRSPMVGTAYLAPEPGAAKFINKGDSVSEGDTLLIVEAMKVMNPIKAEKSGTVTQILIDDSQPVEYGDVLAIIE